MSYAELTQRQKNTDLGCTHSTCRNAPTPDFDSSARMVWRLICAVRRQRNLVAEARREHAKRGERLSKQAKQSALHQEMDSNPVMPTFGARRMRLHQGVLHRLGTVTDITHNSGKRQ